MVYFDQLFGYVLCRRLYIPTSSCVLFAIHIISNYDRRKILKNVFLSSGLGRPVRQNQCPLGKSPAAAHDQYFFKTDQHFENSGSTPDFESDDTHGARSLPRKLSKTSEKLSTMMGAYSLDQFGQNSESNDPPKISKQMESLLQGKSKV